MDPAVEPDGHGAYPSSWETDVVLSDGHTVHVRPIVPDDAALLVRFHERQSAESVYMRYFSPRPTLSRRDLEHLTNVDHDDRVAFVVLAGDELIAVGRYERYRGTDTAEVAFFVDDHHRGRGLGGLLLEYLAAAAVERGVRRFAASTLPNNGRMLSVFRNAGYDVATRLADGVVELAFDIDPTDASVAVIGRRERAAEAASVRPLLRPASIAMIGAGRDPDGLGSEVLRNLLDAGFTGPVHAVHPEADLDGRVRTVRSVEDLPEGLDLVILATPAHTVSDLVDACGRRGVRSVLVVSAGFTDAGAEGAPAERELISLARSHGMRLLGPASLGLVNTDEQVRLNATLAPGLPLAGRVAMMAEAGTLSAAILDHAQRMELGLSTVVAAGNRADVSASDLLSYWTDDEATAAVLLYLAARPLEPRFVRAARAASLRQPVAALHTSMVGTGEHEDDGAARRAQALFRQTGVIGVGALEQLFDIGRILADQPVPVGCGVAVVGNSDGAVSLAADACVDAGLDLVPLGLPGAGGEGGGGGRGAAVDLGHAATAAEYDRALRAAVTTPGVHSLLVIHTPPRLAWNEDIERVVLDVARSAPEVTIAATMLGAAGRSRLLDRSGTAVPVFRFPEDAARALGRLASYQAWRSGALLGDAEPPGSVAALAALEVVATARPDPSDPDPTRLDVGQQSLLLAAYGVEMIERSEVSDLEAAVTAAERIGWPVALKASVRNRLARSAASGVVLDLGDAAALRRAWWRLHAAVGDAMVPVVVQRFVDAGIDIAVEVARDPDGSAVVEVGLGGPAAIMGQRELAVLPLTLADASALVGASPAGRVLSDPLDRVPLVELVHRLCALVVQLDEVARVSADPVVAGPGTAAVADVEIELGPPNGAISVRRLE